MERLVIWSEKGKSMDNGYYDVKSEWYKQRKYMNIYRFVGGVAMRWLNGGMLLLLLPFSLMLMFWIRSFVWFVLFFFFFFLFIHSFLSHWIWMAWQRTTCNNAKDTITFLHTHENEREYSYFRKMVWWFPARPIGYFLQFNTVQRKGTSYICKQYIRSRMCVGASILLLQQCKSFKCVYVKKI